MTETRFDRLYRIFTADAFLNSEAIRNEAPLYIQPYDVKEEDQTVDLIRNLASQLSNQGLQVHHVEMFNLCLEILRETGRLERILEKEPELTPVKMQQLLKGRLSLERVIIPRLEAELHEPGLQLTLLSGFGHLYPFLRTHNIIESLYTVLPSHPVVFFFPGEYTYQTSTGSRLSLFGLGQESRGHYRAINLDTYAL